jgi:hypothetical protein
LEQLTRDPPDIRMRADPRSAEATREGPSKRPRRRKLRRSLIALACGLVVALLAGELGLRFLLFSDAVAAKRLGRPWRKMDLYTDSLDDDYWKLQSLFNRDIVTNPPNPNSLVGWTGAVDSKTYAHPDEAALAGRTPVLFFGDSNAQCMTAAADCFQGQMERSEFANEYALLNYGVGGYGLDQIQLLMSASIDRFIDKNPIVIVSFMVDDDMERSMRSFRCWPKPRYHVEDGRLVDPGPVDADTAHFLREHPPRITSYLYRLARNLWHKFDFDTTGGAEQMDERRTLNRLVLERIRDELERRHLRYFFLVFQMEGYFSGSRGAKWAQSVFDEFAAEHHVPFVPTGPFVTAATNSRNDGIGEMIGRNDRVLNNHLRPAGNRVVFEAIRQGLQGRFDDLDLETIRLRGLTGEYRPEHNMARILEVLGFPAGFEAKSELPCVRSRPASHDQPEPRLVLRCGDDGKTRVEIDIRGGCSRIRARVRAVGARPDECEGATLRLFTRTDLGPWTSATYSVGEGPRDYVVETVGKQVLELRLESTGSDPACPWLLIEQLRRE